MFHALYVSFSGMLNDGLVLKTLLVFSFGSVQRATPEEGIKEGKSV